MKLDRLVTNFLRKVCAFDTTNHGSSLHFKYTDYEIITEDVLVAMKQIQERKVTFVASYLGAYSVYSEHNFYLFYNTTIIQLFFYIYF